MLLTLFVVSAVTCTQTRPSAIDLNDRRLKQIPDSVFDNPDLEFLDLGSSIKLKPLAAGTAVSLDSNANHLSFLPEKIGNLKNLKALILSGNNLIQLPASFIELINLETLDLTANPDFDVLKELDKIRQLPSLTQLLIAGVKMNAPDSFFIKRALEPRTKVYFVYQEYGNRQWSK